MSTDRTGQTVRRFEFSVVVGQLFLWVGLLGVATILERGSTLSEAASFIMKLIVIFGAFGMSMYYSISATKLRSKQPPLHDNDYDDNS